MSITPKSNATPTLTIEDFDFNAGKHEVKVTVKVGDFATNSFTAHWETFCEWCQERYDLAGYNWKLRTFTALEARATDYGQDDFDHDEVDVDAQEFLSNEGFGDLEQLAFFRFLVGQLAKEVNLPESALAA